MDEPSRATPARDIVFTLATETLRDMAIRSYMRPPDRLLLTLLGSPRVRRILVAEPFRSKAVAAVRGGSVVALPPTSQPGRYVVSPQRWRRRDPESSIPVRLAYRHYEWLLRRSATRVGCERPVVITTFPLLPGFADLSWASSVVYYARDDWATHPQFEPWHPAIREAYAQIRRRRRKVVAVSDSLLARLAPTGDSLVVNNAVDPVEWTVLPPPPPLTVGLPRPWCVYAGTVDDRLDVDIIRQLSSVGTVILAGPIKDEAHVAPLRSLPSIVLPGNMKRPDVTGLIAAADVCLLPHRITSLTEAMDPLKMYEYLAAGRPVLATNLTPVRDMGPRVRLVSAGNDVVAALRDVLAWPAVNEQERLQFIENNSWASRHSGLLDFLLIDRRSGPP